QDEWPNHHRHLKDPLLVVEMEQLRNMTTADGLDCVIFQPKINVSFPLIVCLALMNLDRRACSWLPFFRLVFHRIYDTMNSTPEFVAQCQSVALGVFPCSAQKFIVEAHERYKLE